MTGHDYQQAAARTLIDGPDWQIPAPEIMLAWNAIGLAGEAGEVADLVKKAVFHRKGLDYEKLAKELGDVLWYVAALCSTAGLSLNDVMAANVEKLKARYPNGWDHARSHQAGQVAVEERAGGIADGLL
jgi:NTP pyrophosphatase (non-canonical NTP hydrolase)